MGLREGPVHMYELPLVVLEVEDVACAPFHGFPGPLDRLLHGRPANAPLFPCVDLVGGDEEGTAELLNLTPPNGAGLVPTPPFRRIRSDDEGARMIRQPSKHGLAVALRDRLCQPIDDAPNFLGRLHRSESAPPDGRK